jgi:hypothetical protein
VRSSAATAPRLLSFEGTGGSVEIEVSEDRIVGQLTPATAADVELRRPGGVRTTRSDDRGRFAFDLRDSPQSAPERTGPASLRIVAPTLRLVTGWIVA